MTFAGQLLLGAPVGTTAGWVLGQLAVNYASDADLTLTTSGANPQSTYNALQVTGTISAIRKLIAPLSFGQPYTVQNLTTGGFAIELVGPSGTGVLVPNGATVSVVCDGTNFLPVNVTPWTTTIDGANNALENAKTITFDQELAQTGAGGTLTVDLTAAQKHKVTLTANTTLAFTAPLGVGNFVLRIIQGGSGSYTITWPTQGQAAGNLAWVGKTVITLSTAVGAEDILSIYYNGSYYAVSYGNNFG